MCDFLRVIAWFCDEKFSLKKSCFYLYIRRRHEYRRSPPGASKRSCPVWPLRKTASLCKSYLKNTKKRRYLFYLQSLKHASHNNTHSNVAHVNSNTTPSHMNTAGGSVPGTAQIPVPQKPQSNTFMKDLPKTAAAVPFSMKPGTTKKPD